MGNGSIDGPARFLTTDDSLLDSLSFVTRNKNSRITMLIFHQPAMAGVIALLTSPARRMTRVLAVFISSQRAQTRVLALFKFHNKQRLGRSHPIFSTTGNDPNTCLIGFGGQGAARRMQLPRVIRVLVRCTVGCFLHDSSSSFFQG